MTTILALATVLVGADPPVRTLDTDRELNGRPAMSYRSLEERGGGRPNPTIITDTLTHHLSGSALCYRTADGVTGAIPPAKAGPRAMTMIRTTFRPLVQVETQFTGTLPDTKDEYENGCMGWSESPKELVASPGDRLEAALIEGDAKGTELVRVACAVAGDPKAGYRYTFTVENRTDTPVKFNWAGLAGTVGPKKTFTKVETAAALAKEESGLSEFDFGKQREFAIRANFWARPK